MLHYSGKFNRWKYKFVYNNWIDEFQLFLFDFDGLLVNTEKIHFEAYQKVCSSKGLSLSWSFSKYCSLAHTSSTGLRNQIYEEFPVLKKKMPNWEMFYMEKKQAYMELIKERSVELMPGAEMILTMLKKLQKKRCVVTNSPKEQVDYICKKQPILNTIPIWFTREDYKNPKPDPDSYLTAINRLASHGDKIIGFEDSLRGIQALLKTPAHPIIICQPNTPGLKKLLDSTTVTHYESLNKIL